MQAACLLLLSATAAWGLVNLRPVTQWPHARDMRPRLCAPVTPGRQRRAAALRMAEAASMGGEASRSGVTRAVRLRPALIGGSCAVALGLSRRFPGLLPILLPLLSVLLPAWSAVRLWHDGKRRAAITLACSAAARRFCTRWWQYCTIPLFAGAVGWLTNKVAVDMIFYPVEFGGLRIRTYPNQPLGFIGWQGIVPAKASEMATRITDLVTGKLLDVSAVFRRIDPSRLSSLLAPGVDRIAEEVVSQMAPAGTGGAAVAAGKAALRGLEPAQQAELLAIRHRYVSGLTRDMQQNVGEIVDLNEIVVGGMVREKRMLIDLFQRCGKEELSFLVNSGFSLGVVLGVFQMLLWLFYERPWTLAVGGAVVGFLTNWVALKLIFEPVEPVQVGPFVLQGMFLKRQHEVSAEFADAMTEKLLSSESLWRGILTGSGSDRFAQLLHKRTAEMMRGAAAVLYGGSDPTAYGGAEHWRVMEKQATESVLEKLPAELHLVHGYIDEALDLRQTLRTNLRKLSPKEFEGLLHPIFQEDELTLIVVGSVLGLAVGYAQAEWDIRSKRGDPNYNAAGRRIDALPQAGLPIQPAPAPTVSDAPPLGPPAAKADPSGPAGAHLSNVDTAEAEPAETEPAETDRSDAVDAGDAIRAADTRDTVGGAAAGAAELDGTAGSSVEEAVAAAVKEGEEAKAAAAEIAEAAGAQAQGVQAKPEVAEAELTAEAEEAEQGSAARAEAAAQADGRAVEADGAAATSDDSAVVERRLESAAQAQSLGAALTRLWARVQAQVALLISSRMPWMLLSEKTAPTASAQAADAEARESDKAEKVEEGRAEDDETASGGL